MRRSRGRLALVTGGVCVDGSSMDTSAALRPIPGSTSDESLVASVRAGSEAAFEMLYDRHLHGILGFCRHMLGSAEEAEDVVQHTFMAAYRDLLASDKPIQLRPWLYTIARNRCFTLLARPPRAPAQRRRRAVDRAPLERRPAPPGPARPAGRPRRAARRPARRARARRGRRASRTTRSRSCSAVPRAQGQGARVPGPPVADRQPQGARHAVRGDPPPAREPPRRRAATHHAAAPPARLRGLPRLPHRRRGAPAQPRLTARGGGYARADVSAATDAQGRRARRPRCSPFRTFSELGERMHEPPQPPPRPEAAVIRIHQLIERDPGGAWVSERRRRARRRGAGARSRRAVGALAARRRPRAPVGRPRPRRCWRARSSTRAAAAAARSSSPPRTRGRCAPTRGPASPPHPSFRARGRPRGVERPGHVRDGDAGDLGLTERVDLGVRGAAPRQRHRGAAARRLPAAGDRGPGLRGDRRRARSASWRRSTRRRPSTCCGPRWRPRRPARRSGSSGSPRSRTGRSARYSTRASRSTNDGAVFVRGDVGPFRPYLPSGAYL